MAHPDSRARIAELLDQLKSSDCAAISRADLASAVDILAAALGSRENSLAVAVARECREIKAIVSSLKKIIMRIDRESPAHDPLPSAGSKPDKIADPTGAENIIRASAGDIIDASLSYPGFERAKIQSAVQQIVAACSRLNPPYPPIERTVEALSQIERHLQVLKGQLEHSGDRPGKEGKGETFLAGGGPDGAAAPGHTDEHSGMDVSEASAKGAQPTKISATASNIAQKEDKDREPSGRTTSQEIIDDLFG